jgi:hypothetical protein
MRTRPEWIDHWPDPRQRRSPRKLPGWAGTLLFVGGVFAVIVVWTAVAAALGFGLVLAFLAWT